MERIHLRLDVGVPCLCLWLGVGFGCDIEPVPRPGETAASIGARKLLEEEGGAGEKAFGSGSDRALRRVGRR